MLTLFTSRISDARDIIALLDASGQQWRSETLSMASESERQRWQNLKSQYRWSTLPMVVADDRLIGGAAELRAYLADSDGTRTAQALGYGGLIPFVLLAVSLILGVDIAGIDQSSALLTYAASILSFVGALQWGFALRGADHPARRYSLSVLPSLTGWFLLILPLSAKATAMYFAIAFAAWFAIEKLTSWHSYPAWFRTLRVALTTIVTATMAAVSLLGS